VQFCDIQRNLLQIPQNLFVVSARAEAAYAGYLFESIGNAVHLLLTEESLLPQCRALEANMNEQEETKVVEGTLAAGEKTKVIHTTNLEFQTALNTIDRILETARDGNFTVEADGKSITLVPAAEVQFEIKAKEGGVSQSIAFELRWPSTVEDSASEARVQQRGSETETCVADLIRMNRETAERENAELERRFERELFGGCGCVEVPGPE
jgi:amphi-Trp domain-containing protein